MIDSAVRATDAQLLAYAIMPNHLHLVVRQGNEALGYLMQMLLRRTALLTQRTHDVAGHVFERRYRDQPCLDAGYARNAIVYTHLNPVRAGLCDDPGDYAWTSHPIYCGEAGPGGGLAERVAVRDILPLFGTGKTRTAVQLRADYMRFVEWRLAADRHRSSVEAGDAATAPPPEPDVLDGDLYWVCRLARSNGASASANAALPWASGVERIELRTIAEQVLREHDTTLRLETVRGRHGGRPIAELRRRIIVRASRAGYRGVEIARFLKLSESTVSKVVASMRASAARR